MLLGSPAFYGRFGFRPGSEWGLSNPYAGVDEGDFVIQEGDFQIAVAGGRADRAVGGGPLAPLVRRRRLKESATTVSMGRTTRTWLSW